MSLTERPRMMNAQYCVIVIMWHLDNFLEVIGLKPCLFKMSIILWAEMCNTFIEPWYRITSTQFLTPLVISVQFGIIIAFVLLLL